VWFYLTLSTEIEALVSMLDTADSNSTGLSTAQLVAVDGSRDDLERQD
jgi:hypothetical protein